MGVALEGCEVMGAAGEATGVKMGVWGDWGAVEERVEGEGEGEEVLVVWVEGRVVMGVLGVWARGEVGGGLMQESGVGDSLKRELWMREGTEEGEEQEGREGEGALGLIFDSWA